MGSSITQVPSPAQQHPCPQARPELQSGLEVLPPDHPLGDSPNQRTIQAVCSVAKNWHIYPWEIIGEHQQPAKWSINLLEKLARLSRKTTLDWVHDQLQQTIAHGKVLAVREVDAVLGELKTDSSQAPLDLNPRATPARANHRRSSHPIVNPVINPALEANYGIIVSQLPASHSTVPAFQSEQPQNMATSTIDKAPQSDCDSIVVHGAESEDTNPSRKRPRQSTINVSSSVKRSRTSVTPALIAPALIPLYSLKDVSTHEVINHVLSVLFIAHDSQELECAELQKKKTDAKETLSQNEKKLCTLQGEQATLQDQEKKMEGDRLKKEDNFKGLEDSAAQMAAKRRAFQEDLEAMGISMHQNKNANIEEGGEGNMEPEREYLAKAREQIQDLDKELQILAKKIEEKGRVLEGVENTRARAKEDMDNFASKCQEKSSEHRQLCQFLDRVTQGVEDIFGVSVVKNGDGDDNGTATLFSATQVQPTFSDHRDP